MLQRCLELVWLMLLLLLLVVVLLLVLEFLLWACGGETFLLLFFRLGFVCVA
jgi:hypothetical protein